MAKTSYVIALGSNRRHHRHGSPDAVLAAARSRLAESGLTIRAIAPTFRTAAVGPAGRSFANSAILAETDLDPPALLRLLKGVERAFGRRRGRRWGARVLDLDIILWSGGAWQSGGLRIPHPAFAERRFVLDPVLAIAPGWRAGGLTIRHHHARLTRP